MSTQINVAFVEQYRANVEHLLQEKGSKLRKAVMTSTHNGKGAVAVEQFGAVSAVKRTTRHADTPRIDVPQARRWVFPVDYEWADLVDDQDKLRMLIDPTSPYAEAGAMAMGRAIDDEIITAAFATSLVGENGTTSEAFGAGPSGETVTIGTGTGMTVQKLRLAKKLLMENFVDIDSDPLFVAMSAEQIDDLLSETQTTSLDYNTRPVLVDGKITAFMGFNFIHTERLGTTAGERRCIAWAKSGIHLGIWGDVRSQIADRPDKSHATQVYCSVTIGATRTQNGKVIEILCTE
jgi:hypothetical protein